MTVAVLTLAHGRHDHLRGLVRALAVGTRTPDLVVVAALGDLGVREVVAADAGSLESVQVLDISVGGTGLPLALARNRVAGVAIDAGADVLIFLDVDCLATPDLVGAYARACGARYGSPGPHVFAGPVHYLPAPPTGGYTPADLALSQPHPARPVPAQEIEEAADALLFWSLSFAVSAVDWMTIGGFDEAYTGYGGEDTDFAMRLGRCSGRLWWVRDAVAHHQHHDISSPPVEHLGAIIRNANLFHDRWGFFPMTGWLEQFETAGLIRPVPTRHGPRWRMTEPETLRAWP